MGSNIRGKGSNLRSPSMGQEWCVEGRVREVRVRSDRSYSGHPSLFSSCQLKFGTGVSYQGLVANRTYFNCDISHIHYPYLFSTGREITVDSSWSTWDKISICYWRELRNNLHGVNSELIRGTPWGSTDLNLGTYRSHEVLARGYAYGVGGKDYGLYEGDDYREDG